MTDQGVCSGCDVLQPVEVDEYQRLVVASHQQGKRICFGAALPPRWLRADVARNYPNRIMSHTALYSEDWGERYPTRAGDLRRG